jgi:hypothetical protein
MGGISPKTALKALAGAVVLLLLVSTIDAPSTQNKQFGQADALRTLIHSLNAETSGCSRAIHLIESDLQYAQGGASDLRAAQRTDVDSAIHSCQNLLARLHKTPVSLDATSSYPSLRTLPVCLLKWTTESLKTLKAFRSFLEHPTQLARTQFTHGAARGRATAAHITALVNRAVYLSAMIRPVTLVLPL